MSVFRRYAFVVICLCGVLLSCSGQPSEEPGTVIASEAGESSPASGDGVVGQIRGTSVSLETSEFDGDLAVFEGDGWGWNPSLLIFLFLEDKSPPIGQVISVDPTDDLSHSNPHVHFRWKNPESDQIDVDSVMDGYRMRLSFDAIEAGYVTGTLEFSVPDEATEVSGSFRALIKQ